MENQVKCPKCASTQISANKKGFSGGQAVTGALLFGGVGLLAGTAGSGKVKITCLSCGHVFNPGDNPSVVRSASGTPPATAKNLIIFSVVFFILFMALLFILKP